MEKRMVYLINGTSHRENNKVKSHLIPKKSNSTSIKSLKYKKQNNKYFRRKSRRVCVYICMYVLTKTATKHTKKDMYI